jgi:hypothetical protein
MVLKLNVLKLNEDASIQGLTLFILMLIFSFAAFMWLTMPLSDGVSTSVTAFWAASGSAPDAAYIAGFQNIAALNDGRVIAMLALIFSGISFLIVALRSRFTVG